jgi:SAM-dependent methyltransferase
MMTENLLKPTPTQAARGQDTPASPWVMRWLPAARGSKTLLDFACGSGRHARLGHALGYRVLAVDRDAQALSNLEGSGVTTLQEDVEHGRWSLRAERFDVVVCTHYLFRPRLDVLAGLLAPGGRLIYETFAVGQERFGRPTNPAFLLRPGELLGLADRAGLHVLAFEDGQTSAPRATRLQRLTALRAPVSPDDLLLT